MLSDAQVVKQGQIPFLSNPSCISELDSWITSYIQHGSRFTFREGEVLLDIWQQGEDIRLREDERFRQVPFTISHEEQWYLAAHTLANDFLYNSLLDEIWDGQNLYQELENYDAGNIGTYHVFCPSDIRLQILKDEYGVYQLVLRAAPSSIMLTSEQKVVVDALEARLLEQTMLQSQPLTTTDVLEALQGLSPDDAQLQTILPQALAHWLLHQDNWIRVGIDTWFPEAHVPILEAGHRYAVLPSQTSSVKAKDAFSLLTPAQIIIKDILPEDEQKSVEEINQEDQMEVRWRILLKTVHINEAILPVPSQARSLYPRASRLANIVAIAGLWFDDASSMTIWLDKKQNRFFGPDLEEHFTFIEAGTRLDIHWNASGIIFYVTGVDTQTAEEETRLIDLTSLAQLRNQTIESYRASLRSIFEVANHPLKFRDLYEQLCERQHHKACSATIRTILSSSPEFGYDSTGKCWRLLPMTRENSVKTLRRITTIAKHLKEHSGDTQQIQDSHQEAQEAPSLSQMVSSSRQRLARLRFQYLGRNENSS